jgi:hypothetical protein
MGKHLFKYGIIISGLIFFYSCSLDDGIIANGLYKKRDVLLKEFKDKSIIKVNSSSYQLSYYNDLSVNTFSFKEMNGVWVLASDTTQYPISEISAFKSLNLKDRIRYKKAISQEFSRLLKEMNSLNIRSVSSEFSNLGVNLKIYFGDYKALLYISDISLVKNEEWRNYINTGKKFDENWYYVMDKIK